MLAAIPPPVLAADQAHHGILTQVVFSRHLNPCNAEDARRAFLRGAEAPPFEYVPLREADALLRILDDSDPPRDHPAGALVGRCLDGTRLLVRALRDRTAAAFDAMARAANWYPDPALLALRFPDARDATPLDVPAARIIARLERALEERQLTEWRVEPDTVMSARVLVDGAKRMLRVNPRARFRERDVERLVVHEVDVHAMRAENGMRQVLRCFQTGLPGSLATEEGLAMVSEAHSGHASPGVLARQTDVVRAIDRARQMGFRALYETLCDEVGPGLAWGISLRIKRGLARPDLPGVYAKDSVYLRGQVLVREWLDEGGSPDLLYVGKVSVTDPVQDWLDQGWLQPGRVPPTWTDAA
ncbi:MAG: tyrosine/phenylalanine carboxypeptidase domain-containing protein [Myxococcota bacterium]|nr:tyrosine/phenylalanine carboxypeptidase domain-containing protein [Myxococcota bacterium]